MITSSTVFAVMMFFQANALSHDASAVAVPQTNIDRQNRSDATRANQVATSALPMASALPQAVDRSLTSASDRVSSPLGPAIQITPERGQAFSGLDLRPVAPNVGAPASPAQRLSGRDLSTIVPTGPDRCDPRSQPRSAFCDRVIETRSDEFRPSDPQPLSPEQRLLGNQLESRSQSSDVNAATRRLGNGELDSSNIALGVASIALRGPPRPTDEKDPAAEPAALDAIVASITTLVTGAPPNP